MRASGVRRVFHLRGLPQPYVAACAPGPTATELAKEAPGEEGMKAFASLNPLPK